MKLYAQKYLAKISFDFIINIAFHNFQLVLTIQLKEREDMRIKKTNTHSKERNMIYDKNM